MTTILIPQYDEIVLPDASSVRPDEADCRSYCDEVTARMRAVGLESLHSGKFVTHDETAIAAAPTTGYGTARQGLASSGRQSNWVQPGMSTGANGGCPPWQQRDGGTPQPGCDPHETTCGRVPLPINTIGKSGYPLVGTGLGTLTVGPVVTYKALRAQRYYPKSVFFTCLDQLNGLVAMQGFLVLPKVSGNPQVVGTNADIDAAIPSAVNSLGFGPFVVDSWKSFTNTEPEFLQLQWGHIYAASTSMQVVGLMFGDAAVDFT